MTSTKSPTSVLSLWVRRWCRLPRSAGLSLDRRSHCDADVGLPRLRESRRSFGINVLGTLVVQVEADDGTIGFGVTTAGEPGAWIVERHLARFLEGALVTDVEKIWDQMFRSTLFYGRKGWCSMSSVQLILLSTTCSVGCGRSRSISYSAVRCATS